MKRIAIIALMLAAMMTANATSVLYFTRSQADRAVSYLNRQNELMIYCGYDYEIETYVLLNEVWAEKVNSSFYELWIYGYDAYTGEEIYMPIDLQCIWLYSAGRMYNAAQYLRFRTDGHLRMPTTTWTVPAYNHFTRVVHRPGYTRTYHYEVHRHGWMPPARPSNGYNGTATHPYHPYYMRAPHEPAPRPANTWTPGVDNPRIEHPAQAPSSGAHPTPTGINSGNRTAPTRSGNGTPTTPTNNGGTSATPTHNGSAPNTAPTRRNSSTAPTQNKEIKTTAPTQNKEIKTSKPTQSKEIKTTAPTQNKEIKTSKPTQSKEIKTTSKAPSRK